MREVLLELLLELLDDALATEQDYSSTLFIILRQEDK
jgi:hypothetical protein